MVILQRGETCCHGETHSPTINVDDSTTSRPVSGEVSQPYWGYPARPGGHSFSVSRALASHANSLLFTSFNNISWTAAPFTRSALGPRKAD